MAGVVGSPWGRALRLGAAGRRWSSWLGVAQGLSMLIVVAAIVVMIFLHELGHYVMAKRAGHAGHRVLPRLRSADLVVPPWRDRVRPQGDPGRAPT